MLLVKCCWYRWHATLLLSHIRQQYELITLIRGLSVSNYCVLTWASSYLITVDWLIMLTCLNILWVVKNIKKVLNLEKHAIINNTTCYKGCSWKRVVCERMRNHTGVVKLVELCSQCYYHTHIALKCTRKFPDFLHFSCPDVLKFGVVGLPFIFSGHFLPHRPHSIFEISFIPHGP